MKTMRKSVCEIVFATGYLKTEKNQQCAEICQHCVAILSDVMSTFLNTEKVSIYSRFAIIINEL